MIFELHVHDHSWQCLTAVHSLFGLQVASISLPDYAFAEQTILVLGAEKEGIPPEILDLLDAQVEIPQLGLVRSLNVHVSGAIAAYEYRRQHPGSKSSLVGTS